MQTTLPMSSGLTNDVKVRLWAAADKLRGHLDAERDEDGYPEDVREGSLS